MKQISLLPLLACTLFSACKSHKPNTLTAQYATTFKPDVSAGSYYKTKAFTSFYDSQPDSLIGKTPTHVWATGRVVQLMDANSGGGWARVIDESGESGFVQFSNLKIVPLERQPATKRRHSRDEY